MVNYTIRPILWTHKSRKDGICPVMIAITINRKVTYIKTAYKVKESNWNGSAVAKIANEKYINIAIRKQIADIEREIVTMQLDGKSVNSKLIKNISLGRGASANFYKFCREVKNGYSVKEVNRLMAFAGGGLDLAEIDYSFIHKYEAHERKRGMSENTMNTAFKWFRKIVTHAYKRKLIKSNPFEDYDIPKYSQSERIWLDAHERDAWLKYWSESKKHDSLYITLTYFLIGCFSGLRHSDWGSARSRIAGDFLRLRAKKNKEWVVLPIGKSLRQLLSADVPPPFSGDKSREHLKIIAGRLEMAKNITTHSARHTFGAMCAELRLPKSVTAELMGITVQTVDVYYHLTGQNIIDQASVLREV